MTAASTVTRSVGMNPSTPQNLGASHLRVDAVIDAAIAEQQIVGAVVLVARKGTFPRRVPPRLFRRHPEPKGWRRRTCVVKGSSARVRLRDCPKKRQLRPSPLDQRPRMTDRHRAQSMGGHLRMKGSLLVFQSE
jgi:hypothetical protein